MNDNVAAREMKRLLPVAVSGFAQKSWLLSRFATRFFRELFLPPFEFRETIKQLYFAAYKSFPIVGVTGAVMGVVLTLQARPTMVRFGAESLIPVMVATAIVREIGPVIIALICAGKIGSGIGAELGSMKVTEQIDAMEVGAINPFKFLVVTRVLATTVAVPILVLYADAIGLFGGYVALNFGTDVSLRLYVEQIFATLRMHDLIPATLKTIVFGYIIGMVGCYEGIHASRGTESVGWAANNAVVTSSLLIILVDMLAVQITQIVY